MSPLYYTGTSYRSCHSFNLIGPKFTVVIIEMVIGALWGRSLQYQGFAGMRSKAVGVPEKLHGICAFYVAY